MYSTSEIDELFLILISIKGFKLKGTTTTLEQHNIMSDSNPVVFDTVLCWLQIVLNLSRTPCLGYKTFLLDTSIQIQTFNYDCIIDFNYRGEYSSV